MGLIATIHTTDIELMAELVAAAKHHGPVEIRYVDGGLELHRAATGPDAVIVPLNTTTAPAAPRPASKRKPATKKPTPAPVEAEDATLCPDCGHVANTANGLAIHRARRHGIAGAHANRRTPTKTNKPAPKAAPKPTTGRPIDHDAVRSRAADGI